MNVGLLRQKARQDLVDIVHNYVQTAGIRVARRFLVEVEKTISRLAGVPGTGAIYDSIDSTFVGVCICSVSEYCAREFFARLRRRNES